jgi:NAD(P)H-hydrate epimerase
MTLPLAADRTGHVTRAALTQVLAQPADVVACGPGLGRSDEAIGLVNSLFVELKKPMVFDADALNALAVSTDIWERLVAPRILTPHPGEFRRLLGRSDLDEVSCRELANEWAQEHGVVLVLKGHQTLITDGRRHAMNSTGNPGMATGGCGDVLTGVITALLCQGLEPFQAAQLGVFVHGRAGDLAAAELGQISLIASDLVDYLPMAFQSLDKA